MRKENFLVSYKEDIVNKNLELFDDVYTTDKVNLIPSLEDKRLVFGSKGLSFDVTVLYIDIKNPSLLMNTYTPKVVAKIHMDIFNTVVQIVSIYNGEVRSFNGESLLVFFKDTGKTVINSAVQAALIIKYMLAIDENSLNKFLIRKYDKSIDFGIGIDCGTVICSKMCFGGGNNSSLIFSGNCVNKASIISKIRAYPSNIGITDEIYSSLDDKNKYTKADCDLCNQKYLWRLEYLNYNRKMEFCYSTTYCCVI
jgi:adenylate cyclase